MSEGATTVAQGRNYVVVSADTHASPDSLDHFLSYVDPAQREAVAAFGDMSNLAISMFGGFDPGEVDESDPVRATAARRLAGMGVDIAATYPLDRVADAFEELEQRHTHGKIVLLPQDS